MQTALLEEAACLAGAQMVAMIAEATKTYSQREKVDPFLQERCTKGRFAKDFEDLVSSESRFKENFHMDLRSFNELYALVSPLLQPKKRTHPIYEISPKEKLAIVFEYFACGTLQRHIASVYRISKQQRKCSVLQSLLLSGIFQIVQVPSTASMLL
ncbi:uncharacterized protein LOC118734946 [Rhagoletis pomonella]|uniref:uncharacterized protein LOC118734946 n=1 Tax=Rhagoletis pomonella TaxID=28610 RepID=UPI001786D7E6|nr:uncharacterized protein LOC118734946 [Rhagoletis pomonella]